MLVNILGWVGDVLLLWGVWEIGNKRRYAHLLTIAGELTWIAKCLLVTPPTWDLIVICACFTVLAGRCWILWGGDGFIVEHHTLRPVCRICKKRRRRG